MLCIFRKFYHKRSLVLFPLNFPQESEIVSFSFLIVLETESKITSEYMKVHSTRCYVQIVTYFNQVLSLFIFRFG